MQQTARADKAGEAENPTKAENQQRLENSKRREPPAAENTTGTKTANEDEGTTVRPTAHQELSFAFFLQARVFLRVVVIRLKPPAFWKVG